jgi:hypothetical protein
MLENTMEEKAAVPLANILGFVLGLFSVSIILIKQSLLAIMPLIFAPMVCGILCTILYKSQKNVSIEPRQLPPIDFN